MTKNADLEKKILKVVNSSDEPITPREIADKLGVSWDMVSVRLKILHAAGQIDGREIPGGKGMYIYWRKGGFGNAP